MQGDFCAIQIRQQYEEKEILKGDGIQERHPINMFVFTGYTVNRCENEELN